MRFIATTSIIAYSGALSISLAASAALADGRYAPRAALPHVIEARDVIPSPRPAPGVARHLAGNGRYSRPHGGTLYNPYGGVFYRTDNGGRYDDSYRPAAYSAADAYPPPPPPPAYGYIVRPIVEPPYPAADYIELTGFQPLPHIIYAAPAR